MSMWEEFENALAWYAAAPARWTASAKQDLSAAAEWLWVVLQGDFAEEQTVAQSVTGTVISMIPLVDQLCDVRDVVANCRKINQDRSNKWAWLALLLTLIGLFPTLGSLFKGCCKILFAYGRKALFSAGKAALDADLWQASKPFVEAGVRKLNDFLARPEVRKTLAALKSDNPYQYLAGKIRELAASVSVAKLTKAFDTAIGALTELIGMVQEWGSAAMATKAGQLLQSVKAVRDQADTKLAEVLKPAQDWLNRLAQRLDVEWRVKYRADVNVPNPHGSPRFSLDAEIEELKKAPPGWVDVVKEGKFPELRKEPAVPSGHFDIGKKAPQPHKEAFKTFHSATPDVLPPGTVIYRVLAPNSYDNSICWMTKAEFDKLRNKDDWRRRFAVWMNWNVNGEFATYTVPPGKGLPVWRGATASQVLKDKNGVEVLADAKGNKFWLEGGAEQLVVNPTDLRHEFVSERKFTGWSYDEGNIEVNLVGVPILQTNWK
jgi:hypothetical protein